MNATKPDYIYTTRKITLRIERAEDYLEELARNITLARKHSGGDSGILDACIEQFEHAAQAVELLKDVYYGDRTDA